MEDSIVICYAQRAKLVELGVLKDDRVAGGDSDILAVWDHDPNEAKPRVADVVDLTIDAEDVSDRYLFCSATDDSGDGSGGCQRTGECDPGISGDDSGDDSDEEIKVLTGAPD
jgi:hypothetical protein